MILFRQPLFTVFLVDDGDAQGDISDLLNITYFVFVNWPALANSLGYWF